MGRPVQVREGPGDGERSDSAPLRPLVSAGPWESPRAVAGSVGRGPWRGLSATSWGPAGSSLGPLLEPDWLQTIPELLGAQSLGGGGRGTPRLVLLHILSSQGPSPSSLCPLFVVMETRRPPRRCLCLKKGK